MLELVTFIKVSKILLASTMFYGSKGDLGLRKGEPHFYDDPVPGDSFPHNMFYLNGQGAGGRHAGTYRGF
jgi:hypothetical protein